MAEMKIKLKPFIIPNYVTVDMPVGRREDGFKEAPKYHISELDDDTIEQLCKEFVEGIYAKKKEGRDKER